MSTVLEAPPEVHPARQKTIQPFLDKLQAWCQSPAGSKDPDAPAKISIGSQALIVEPWDRAQLQQFFRPAEPTDAQAHAKLVAHGLGVIIKSTLDVERLKKHQLSRSAEIYALQAELMLDSAVGQALLTEIDHAIASEVQGGGVEAAKPLSAFRHKLARAVGEARRRIAESDQKQADALAACMTAPAAAAQPKPNTPSSTGGDAQGHAQVPNQAPNKVEARAHVPSGATAGVLQDQDPLVVVPSPRDPVIVEDAPADPDAPLRPRRRRRRSRPATDATSARAATAKGAGVPKTEPPLSRTAVLSLATTALILIWLATVQLPSMLATGLPVIEAAQINSTADLTVVARPPSLYVTVPVAQWETFSKDDQQSLIDAVAATSASAGYDGAILSTDDGRPVGRWLRARGGEPVRQHDTGSVQF